MIVFAVLFALKSSSRGSKHGVEVIATSTLCFSLFLGGYVHVYFFAWTTNTCFMLQVSSLSLIYSLQFSFLLQGPAALDLLA